MSAAPHGVCSAKEKNSYEIQREILAVEKEGENRGSNTIFSFCNLLCNRCIIGKCPGMDKWKDIKVRFPYLFNEFLPGFH